MDKRMLLRFKESIGATQFNAIKVSLASPEKIRSLSYGEIKKMETINYRTLKPEKDGLFCARIFGPVKDWECNCGKYKRMKHRGVTCEKCGVEVIQARVRRERMGHIELVAPVCHIWYLKGIPSYMGLALDMSIKDLERVAYFDSYVVISQGKSPYARKALLSSAEYDNYVMGHPQDLEFKAEMGAEAIREVLKLIDLSAEIEHLRAEYQGSTSVTNRHKIIRRIRVLSGFLDSNTTPELMVLEVLPVLPPDLRPLVPLEGGRFASSDLNELYRRVLNRNMRLKRLMDIEAPSVIIKNEKRMLQESVDALIDNGRRGQPVKGSNKRALKSLSEMLRGKQGRFRQNLLGKRVDYSGRSVIVVDPELKLSQCGLPKIMALELFKPFVLAELVIRELAANLRVAKRMVENMEAIVWDILEAVVQDKVVLLNRAPTLHRLGIQAFYPILVDGKAIKIHPLVCAAFNADFDGDQMAVHVPLSRRAQLESKTLVLATNNLLSPANGKPLTVPSQDMVLGLHYMTKGRRGLKGEGSVFSDVDETIQAFQSSEVELHSRVKLRLKDRTIVETTVGRVVLFSCLPENSDLSWVNFVVRKTDIAKLIGIIYRKFGPDVTVETLDKIKKLGFFYSTAAGLSFTMDDLIVPTKKAQILKSAEAEVRKIEELYMDGAITNGERSNKVVSVWGRATSDIAKSMMEDFEQQNIESFENKSHQDVPFNSLFMMLESGAKGSKDQIKQLVGIRGLMAKPSGEIMETPVKSNFKDGLSVFEYFLSTHGARKGQADTALKTANSGYLTRRLVDVAQDVVITTDDCKSLGYIELGAIKEGGETIYPLARRIFGRVLAADVRDEVSGKLIAQQGDNVDFDTADRISKAAVSQALVRSVLTCQVKRGVCSACYGMDLSAGELAYMGTAVGVIAAQSIGEPGTQLTMRTFHIGGTASVTEQSNFTAKHDGVVEFHGLKLVHNKNSEYVCVSRKASMAVVSGDGRILQTHDVEYGSTVLIKDGQAVKPGMILVEWDANNKGLFSEKTGTIKYVDLIKNVTLQKIFDEATGITTEIVVAVKGDKYQPALAILDDMGEEIVHYYLPINSYLVVKDGQKVDVGDLLVKTPREISKTRDISTGLPRVAELFEARMPKDAAAIAEIDGQVVIGGLHRGLRKISVVAGERTCDYLVTRDKQLNFVDGDMVEAGDLLTSGEPVLHDMLVIKGPDYVQKYLVNQIQQIYRLHGVDIDDRHIEVIVRQMLRKVKIVEAGDSDFLIGDKIDRARFRMVNSLLQSEGKQVARAKPILMGITMASLGTESFISAASFQETTRILSEAAVSGQVDHLYGLKENIVIGKLIPAGTGIEAFGEHFIHGGKQKSDAARSAVGLVLDGMNETV